MTFEDFVRARYAALVRAAFLLTGSREGAEDLLGLQRGAGGHWRQVALSLTDWLAESETITSGQPEPPTVDWEDRGPLTDGGQPVTGDLRDLAVDPTGTRLAFTRPKGGEWEYVAGPLDGTAWRVLSRECDRSRIPRGSSASRWPRARPALWCAPTLGRSSPQRRPG
ncbi:hypothetical protein [Nostocoides australiense]